jgi:hypothetical protein
MSNAGVAAVVCVAWLALAVALFLLAGLGGLLGSPAFVIYAAAGLVAAVLGVVLIWRPSARLVWLASAAFALLFAVLGVVAAFKSSGTFPSATTVVAWTTVAAFVGFVSLRRITRLGRR